MRAWASPPVPSLAGHGLGHGSAPRVHDTRSGQRLSVAPSGTARMYVCGITPVRRHPPRATRPPTWRSTCCSGCGATPGCRWPTPRTSPTSTTRCSSGRRATASTGATWATGEIDLYRADMAALRVLPPDDLVGVTESMDLVIDVVRRLRAAGATYELDGDVYFDVHADPHFGEVGHLDVATMLALSAERGGDPDRPGKRDPLDCLLWLAERPGEPGWDSPFGRGRPGLAHRVRGHLGRATSAPASTCRVAAATWSSRTTRCRRRRPRSPSTRSRSRGRTCTPAWSGSTARRCRSRWATWCWCRGCASRATTRWPCGWRCWPTTTAATGAGPTTTCRPPRSGSTGGVMPRATADGSTRPGP